MKKVFALLLVVAMLCSFAACSGAVDPEDVRGEQSGNEDPSADAEKEFSLGDTQGLTYENKFIGLGCTLDDGWTFYTDDQINQLNNLTADLAGEEYQEAIKNATVIYDMYAISSNQLDNINVNLEKVDPIKLAVLDITNNYEQIYPTIKQSFENMGYTDVSYEIGKVKIGDKEFASLDTSAQISGIKMYQTIFSVKCNGYLANITITSFQEDTTDAILAKFYKTE